MEKTKRLEKYLFDFFESRFDNLNFIFKETHRSRREGIYRLKEGTKLMDFLINIHGNIENEFYQTNLIPQKFTTPEALLSALESFKEYLNENQKYLNLNKRGEDTDYIILEIQKIKDELI